MRRYLPRPETLHRKRGAILGFCAGAALQLVLLGLVSVAYHGGLSDNPAPQPSVYQLY